MNETEGRLDRTRNATIASVENGDSGQGEVASGGAERPGSSSGSPPALQDDQAPSMLALMDRYVRDPSIDVEKFARFLEMKERVEAHEAELAFNAAKGRVLQKLANLKIVKNKWVRYDLDKNNKSAGQYDAFKYAPLEEIDRHLSPLLAAENMDLSYSDEPREAGVLIRGRLKHLPSGHFEDSFMAAPLDTTGGKSNVQAVGSTNSYLRRYVACNLFNIVVVGDDDDGRGGLLSEEQVSRIVDLIEKAKVGPKFLEFMNAQSVEETGSLEEAVATIAAKDYAKARVTLEERIAKNQASGIFRGPGESR